jgi:hypothetical protein
MLDPSADNTDVYAFTADDAPNALTVVANWIPGRFRQTDRTSSGSTIERGTTSTSTTPATAGGHPLPVQFKTSVKNPNSFLYAGPGTQDFNDPGLNISSATSWFGRRSRRTAR